MADESTLKIELAKLQAEVHSLETEVSQLAHNKERSGAVAEAQKTRAIEEAKASFENKKRQDLEMVASRCEEMYNRADALIDTFPGMKTKEYAGKYEVRAIEEQLATVYPKAFIEGYVCADYQEFKTESEAYAVYNYVERKVAGMKQGNIVGSLFDFITSMLSTLSRGEGTGWKIALVFVFGLLLSFVFAPFLFLTLLLLVAVMSAIQGLMVHGILRDLYSIKQFLNDAYDEDIFKENKQGILEFVQKYLDDAKDAFCREINSREFVMNQKILEELDRKNKDNEAKTAAALSLKQQLLAKKKEEAAQKLEELDKVQHAREEAAKNAREKYLKTITWSHEWMSSFLVDVTSDNRIQGCRWQQCNTIYYSKNLDELQTFWQLAIYQGMLQMHPEFCGQVVLDYRYMGSNLMLFSQVIPSICQLCTDKEMIDKKVSRIRDDIKARCNNILRSCESIEEFNKLMATYDAAGESYIIVHICGLQSVSEDLKMFLKNGPKVGYFFKIYLTTEEYKVVAKDFPYDDITEYAEVASTVTPRTSTSLRRLAEETT